MIPHDVRTRLFRAGEARWSAFREQHPTGWAPFVATDYPQAYATLLALRDRADSFVELGAGVGVVTILAALLGYDAAGIECDGGLVETAEELAREFAAPATFAEGSFVPSDAVARFEADDEEFLTVCQAADGWTELGRRLDDFDLVYAFYWPGLEELFFSLMRDHGRAGAWLLTFGGTEGFRLWRDGRPAPI